MRLPAKQNVIKPPPPPPTPLPPPPKEQAEQMTENGTGKKTQKSAKRRIAESMVSQSQEYTTQATFFELRAKSQPKKHDGIVRGYSVVFFESENETQPSPTTSATSGRVRNPRAGRCFRSQGETALKEKNRQQDIKAAKTTPESEPARQFRVQGLGFRVLYGLQFRL